MKDNEYQRHWDAVAELPADEAEPCPACGAVFVPDGEKSKERSHTSDCDYMTWLMKETAK